MAMGFRSVCTAALAVVLSWTAAVAQPVVREEPAPGFAVNIGTATTTGIYHAAGSAICRLLAHSAEGKGVACTSLFSPGSAQNIPDLKAGKINFAIIQSDVQHFAWRGERVFGELGPMPTLRHVVDLMPEALTVVAGRNTGITTGADLFGRRVNLGQYGSGTFVLREMLGAIDPRVKTIQAIPDLKTALSADALCRGTIDAFAFVAGYPNPLVQQATAECGAYLVPVVGNDITRLVETYPFYSRIVVPGGTYRSNLQDLPTVGLHATLVTRDDVPADMVYRVTKALYEQLDEFRRLHLAFARFDQNSLSAACNTAPLHEGAARYLKEAGITPPPCPR